MTKSDFARALAGRPELSDMEGGVVVDAFFDAWGQALMAGERIEICDLGTFSVRPSLRRTG